MRRLQLCDAACASPVIYSRHHRTRVAARQRHRFALCEEGHWARTRAQLGVSQSFTEINKKNALHRSLLSVYKLLNLQMDSLSVDLLIFVVVVFLPFVS